MNRVIAVPVALVALVWLASAASRTGDQEPCTREPCNSETPPESEQCDLANQGPACDACANPCDEGWVCVGNTCALILAEGLATPTGIAVDGTHLYFTTQGTRDALDNYNHDGSVERTGS